VEHTKPNCYECLYRRNLSGDVHSTCAHPKAKTGSGPADEVFAIFARVGRMPPVVNSDGVKALNILGSPSGIRHGWFNWPYNFDPVWLESCDGFKAKAEGQR